MKGIIFVMSILPICFVSCFAQSTSTNEVIDGKYTPPSGKTWLFIGQDLDSIRDYVTDKDLPRPYGATTYVNFYSVTRASEALFGGLSITNDMEPKGGDANWGAGPLNAHKTLTENPTTALAIGLYMVGSGAHSIEGIPTGNYDANIDKLAAVIRFANRPVFLRIGYECDGIWNGTSRIFRTSQKTAT